MCSAELKGYFTQIWTCSVNLLSLRSSKMYCRCFFFSRTVKKLKLWSMWFIKCKSAASGTSRLQNISRSYEVKRSVCAKNWTLFPASGKWRNPILFCELILSECFNELVQITDSPVCLHNHAMTLHIHNYIIKSPNNDVIHGCFTCLKHINYI